MLGEETESFKTFHLNQTNQKNKVGGNKEKIQLIKN